MGSANRLSSLAKRLTCVIAVLLLRTQVAKSLETQVSEFQVKAAFLFNFAKFIEWPAGTFADEQQPFTIGIIENNPFAIILEQTVSQKTVKGKTIVVKRCSSPEDLISCRLLFIGKLGRNHISLLIEKVKDAHILTVGEVDGFIQAGGIINFIIVDNKVRFEINNTAAERAGLKISAQLLNLAQNSNVASKHEAK